MLSRDKEMLESRWSRLGWALFSISSYFSIKRAAILLVDFGGIDQSTLRVAATIPPS